MLKIIKARISTISVRKARKRIYFLILELNLLPSDLLNDGDWMRKMKILGIIPMYFRDSKAWGQ